MEFTRVTPSSIPVHDHTGNHDRRRSTSRSAGMPFSSRPPGAMAIPNTRHDPPPPPLPPPRFIDDLTAGSDPGWAWANDPRGAFGKGRGVSAAGPSVPKSWDREMGDKRQTQPSQRPQLTRRDSSTSTVRSPTDAETRHQEFARHQDEGYYSVSGPKTSAMSQQSVYMLFLSSLHRAVPNQVRQGHALPQGVFDIHCWSSLSASGKRV